MTPERHTHSSNMGKSKKNMTVDELRNTGKSVSNLKLDASESRKGFDALWSDAAHAPIFCRTKTVLGADGKKKTTRRTSRLISSMAFKVAASGAALHAKATLGNECREVRVSPRSELKRNPWMPSVTDGACMMLEQFICAVAQEAAERAHIYRESAGCKRLNRTFTQLGWKATVQSVFASTMHAPREVFVMRDDGKKKRKTDKTAQEDGEYTPPDEDDQQPAPHGEEADIAGGD